jgi:ferritin
MKCKGCDNDIRNNLNLIEESITVRISQILDVITDEEDNPDAPYEFVIGKVEEEQEDFEQMCYLCDKCYYEYNYREMLEIFKKGE